MAAAAAAAIAPRVAGAAPVPIGKQVAAAEAPAVARAPVVAECELDLQTDAKHVGSPLESPSVSSSSEHDVPASVHFIVQVQPVNDLAYTGRVYVNNSCKHFKSGDWVRLTTSSSKKEGDSVASLEALVDMHPLVVDGAIGLSKFQREHLHPKMGDSEHKVGSDIQVTRLSKPPHLATHVSLDIVPFQIVETKTNGMWKRPEEEDSSSVIIRPVALAHQIEKGKDATFAWCKTQVDRYFAEKSRKLTNWEKMVESAVVSNIGMYTRAVQREYRWLIRIVSGMWYQVTVKSATSTSGNVPGVVAAATSSATATEPLVVPPPTAVTTTVSSTGEYMLLEPSVSMSISYCGIPFSF